jgi:Flp pilus assembly protein TadB
MNDHQGTASKAGSKREAMSAAVIWAMPIITIIGSLLFSFLGDPVLADRPAIDAKMHRVTMMIGVLGLLLYVVMSWQQQRIERLERRLAELTDAGAAR